MPPTISSCLNSCGDWGSAYHEPGPQPGRHDEVARTLGRRAGHRRRLDLDEALLVQRLARGAVHLRAQPDRRGRAGPAQVEVAVLEPHLLADLGVLVDLERQRRGLVQHDDGRRDDLDLAGRQVRVDVLLLAARGRRRSPASTHSLRRPCTRSFSRTTTCDDAGRVAQVDERHPAVVATGARPSRPA